MRNGRGHLPRRAHSRGMTEFEVRHMQARLETLMLQLFGQELLVGVGKLSRALCDSALKCLVEMTQLEFRALLRPQILADRSDVDSVTGARIIDTKPVEQKRDLGAAGKMAKGEFAAPVARSPDGWPSLVACASPVLRREELQDVQWWDWFVLAKPDKPHSRGIDISRCPVEIGITDKIGRAFDESDEPPRLGLALPAMKGQRHLARGHSDEQSLSFGRKAAGLGAGGDHADAVKADRRDRQPKRFTQRRIGDRYSLATACASDFALHGGRNQIAASRVDRRWRHNDVNGRTLARESDIDEVGANYRGQRGCGAVGDPAGLVVVPHCRQRRQGDQVADESPEFQYLRMLLQKRGCGVVDTLAPFGHRVGSLCDIELRRRCFRSRSCLAAAASLMESHFGAARVAQRATSN